MERIDTDHYTLISKDGNISDKIRSYCKKGYQKNRSFFGQDANKFKIIITHKENNFKKEAGKRYKPWAKGYGLKGKKVIVRSIESHERCYKKYKGTRDISLIITHEINHIFSQQLNIDKGPYWLFEGIAMYVAGQKIGRNQTQGKKLSKNDAKYLLMYRMLRKKLSPRGYMVYDKATRYLINKYGIQRLRKLLSTYSKNMRKKDFENNFRKIYPLTYKEFCDKVISLF